VIREEPNKQPDAIPNSRQDRGGKREAMKHLPNLAVVLLFLALLFASTSLGGQAPGKSAAVDKWEYKVISVSSDVGRVSKFTYTADVDVLKQTTVEPREDVLNAQGAAGWELVNCYLEMETAFPNFAAKQELVTGLQPNVRPSKLVLIFKRKN
jgi:hypothetical protein